MLQIRDHCKEVIHRLRKGWYLGKCVSVIIKVVTDTARDKTPVASKAYI